MSCYISKTEVNLIYKKTEWIDAKRFTHNLHPDGLYNRPGDSMTTLSTSRDTISPIMLCMCVNSLSLNANKFIFMVVDMTKRLD